MSNLDKLVEEYTARGTNGIPGVVFTAFDKHGNQHSSPPNLTSEPHLIPLLTFSNSFKGKTFLHKASGFTSHNSDAPRVTFQHIFRQASTTKLLTSTCALQLVERGQLTLDEPLTTKLPEVAEQKIIAVSPTGEISYTKPTRAITLRMLLTHTSGVGYDIVDPRLKTWRAVSGERPQTLKGRVKQMIQQPLIFEPGSSWMYGAGLDVVGVLIENITKKSLEVYMADNIFAPLGLKSSSFFVKDKPDFQEKLVAITQRAPNGTLAPGKSANGDKPEQASGGAGAYMSPDDYVKVLQDIIADSPKLLKPSSVALLFTHQLQPDSASMEAFKATMPLLGGDTNLMIKDTGYAINHALGGMLLVGNGETLGDTKGTMSWDGALGTMWFANRERGVAGYYAAQIFPMGDKKNIELQQEFVKEAFARFDA